jgi:hypothetical protein
VLSLRSTPLVGGIGVTTTLATIFLTKAAEWAFGKALDVLWDCFVCSDRNPSRIGNVMHNDLECPNCHRVHRQFTNACQTTVNTVTGRIAHIGVGYEGTSPDKRPPLFKVFRPKFITPMFVLHADHLSGHQLVQRLTVSDFETNTRLYSYDPMLIQVNGNDHWERCHYRIKNRWWMVDEDPAILKDVLKRIVALDVTIENKAKEPLVTERFLEQARVPQDMNPSLRRKFGPIFS